MKRNNKIHVEEFTTNIFIPIFNITSTTHYRDHGVILIKHIINNLSSFRILQGISISTQSHTVVSTFDVNTVQYRCVFWYGFHWRKPSGTLWVGLDWFLHGKSFFHWVHCTLFGHDNAHLLSWIG